MAFCHKCGREAVEGSRFCGHCGASLADLASPQGPGEVTDHEFSAFIGKNAPKYLEKFRKFRIGARESFAATWHWPAFLFGIPWMLYRKLYLWALVAFVLSLVPYVNMAAWIACGVGGNYLYFKHAQRKILEIKSSASSADVLPLLSEAGGVNRWVVAVVVIIALFLVLLGLLAALFVPDVIRDVVTV